MYRKLSVSPHIRAKHSDLLDMPQIVLVQKFTEDGVKDFQEQMEKAHTRTIISRN